MPSERINGAAADHQGNSLGPGKRQRMRSHAAAQLGGSRSLFGEAPPPQSDQSRDPSDAFVRSEHEGTGGIRRFLLHRNEQAIKRLRRRKRIVIKDPEM